MDTATVTIVITPTGTGRDVSGVDYALVALLPEFQSPEIEAWLTTHGYASDRPEVGAHVLTGRHDWSQVPDDAPRLEVPATDALLQQLGDENGTRGSLTAHPYDEATYATALAELHRLGDYLDRRDEIIRAAAASGISREEIDTISGLTPIAIERALAPLDPAAFGAAVHADPGRC